MHKANNRRITIRLLGSLIHVRRSSRFLDVTYSGICPHVVSDDCLRRKFFALSVGAEPDRHRRGQLYFNSNRLGCPCALADRPSARRHGQRIRQLALRIRAFRLCSRVFVCLFEPACRGGCIAALWCSTGNNDYLRAMGWRAPAMAANLRSHLPVRWPGWPFAAGTLGTAPIWILIYARPPPRLGDL